MIVMSELNDLTVECIKINSVGLWRIWDKCNTIILYILMEDGKLTFLKETKIE